MAVLAAVVCAVRHIETGMRSEAHYDLFRAHESSERGEQEQEFSVVLVRASLGFIRTPCQCGGVANHSCVGFKNASPAQTLAGGAAAVPILRCRAVPNTRSRRNSSHNSKPDRARGDVSVPTLPSFEPKTSRTPAYARYPTSKPSVTEHARARSPIANAGRNVRTTISVLKIVDTQMSALGRS
jgi:hypothetical protein